LVVPRNAIFTRDNEAGQVFVLNKDHTVHGVTVVMGDTFNGMTVVAKGLKGDETIVVGGGSRLEDGQKVQVVN
jgi:multidrug efflux pump subunit AcrA (membrane-fusion protein)